MKGAAQRIPLARSVADLAASARRAGANDAAHRDANGDDLSRASSPVIVRMQRSAFRRDPCHQLARLPSNCNGIICEEDGNQ
jgi:hypothetical protein